MSFLHYFAYGSNLHPLRLTARVPSARFVGLVNVPGYRLCFHKRHNEDGSGKCNMYQTHQSSESVIGAIYEMQEKEKSLLDRCEGPGYRCDSITLQHDGKDYGCFVYIAERSHIDDRLIPHCWYKNIVLLGAQYHHFPQHYLDAIAQVTSVTDPDRQQHERHYDLIDRMRDYKPGD